MNYIDHKYIQLIGTELERFKDLGNGTYNFRCPICGDSKKKENKARGYIFGAHKPRFMCHNCGSSSTLSNFIKHLSPGLFLQYKLERFRSNSTETKTESDLPVSSIDDIRKRFSKDDTLFGAVKISSPETNKEIRDYALKERCIPEEFSDSLYSVNDVSDFVKQFERYSNVFVPSSPALVIPFFDDSRNLDWIQCRLINNSFRYITLNISGNDSAPKIWGMEFIDWDSPIYITEGPIDAMSLNNGLAIAGVANISTIKWIKETASCNPIFCYDNDYNNNMEVRQQLLKRISERFGVVIYDKCFIWKDLNGSIVSGKFDKDELNKYLTERTFFGMKASLELSDSKKKKLIDVKTRGFKVNV